MRNRLGRSHPTMIMAKDVMSHIHKTIGQEDPETGGILLGPVGRTEITHFHFDEGASTTRSTYTPDHKTLTRKMKEQWMPRGLDMKGFVHSHPNLMDRLSQGDLTYVARLLRANPDMEWFAMPIVIPYEFYVCPFYVHRSHPNRSIPANIRYI